MLPRPKLASLVAALGAGATLLLLGCSSSSPRDINYGTDVAVGFVPPDGSPTNTSLDGAATLDGAAILDGATADSETASDSEAAFDSANALDGGVLADAGLEQPIDAFIDPADAAIDEFIDAALDGDS